MIAESTNAARLRQSAERRLAQGEARDKLTALVLAEEQKRRTDNAAKTARLRELRLQRDAAVAEDIRLAEGTRLVDSPRAGQRRAAQPRSKPAAPRAGKTVTGAKRPGVKEPEANQRQTG